MHSRRKQCVKNGTVEKSTTKIAEDGQVDQQGNKTKIRKSLSTLQEESDEESIGNMVLPNENVPSKKKLPVNKVIVTEKENAPVLRRSKQAPAVSAILNYAESPDVPKASKSVSTKTKKTVLKVKKGQQTTVKKNKKDNPESGPNHSTQIKETAAIKEQIGIPDIEIPDASILTSVNPPLIYWKELAEQRRIALENTLHENELVRDQLTVLQAENSQLKALLEEAENLAQVVRDIIQ